MSKNDREFIERMIYLAEQGLKVRSTTQVRGALEAIRKTTSKELFGLKEGFTTLLR